MMDCKQALTEAKGDLEQAVVLLRKKGISVAGKKASRVTNEGAVASYIHAGGKIGVLVEVNCESDFVARTDDFKELVHDIAMHIAASDPKFVRKEDVTPEAFEREKDIYRSQAAATGKPPQVVEKIVEGKMSKFYEEVCLLEQPFIRDQTVSIGQLIATKIGKLGENIAVRRFARFKVGEAGETVAITKPEQKSEVGAVSGFRVSRFTAAGEMTSGQLAERQKLETGISCQLRSSNAFCSSSPARPWPRTRASAWIPCAFTKLPPNWPTSTPSASRSPSWSAAGISFAAWPSRRARWIASPPITWACWPP